MMRGQGEPTKTGEKTFFPFLDFRERGNREIDLEIENIFHKMIVIYSFEKSSQRDFATRFSTFSAVFKHFHHYTRAPLLLIIPETLQKIFKTPRRVFVKALFIDKNIIVMKRILSLINIETPLF